MPPTLQEATQKFQNGGAQAQLSADFNKLSPGISTISGPSTGANYAATSTYDNRSNMGKFVGFLGDLGKQTGHLAGAAGKWLGTQLENMVTAPVKFGSAIGHGLLDNMDLTTISAQSKQLDAQMQTLQQNFKDGKINHTSYVQAMKTLSQSYDSLVKENKLTQNRIDLNKQQAIQSGIDVAADLVTILTAGFGKAVSTGVNITGGKLALEPQAAKTASEWIASKVAAPILEPMSGTISKLADNSQLFNMLDKGVQNILQKSTAEVVANAGADMTAGQIARATAVNVAFKYPMTFSFYSPMATEMYHQLDDKKYGDAIRTAAFNAALLLSGGPIGYAFKYGGKALTGLSEKTFGQTSFWDNLSTFYGDGNAAGFANAIREYAGTLKEADRIAFIKDLSAVEKTNIAAMGGDIGGAAYRVAKGMQGQYAFDLTEVSHADALQDMVKFAKSFRVGSQAAEKAGIGPIAIGRLDGRDKGAIMTAISMGDGVDGRLKAWEQWKVENPNTAAANNANFDKQITELIKSPTHEGLGELSTAIMSIKAATKIDGLPQAVVDSLAKDGYVPIRPRNLEAPFKEGADQLATKFNGKDNFFIKSVQPLPVLGSIGSLFTHMGLSPNSSQNLSYQLFNDNLSKTLAESKAFTSVVGETTEQSTDIMLKTLSDFAKGKKIPIKDLRQLTKKDIVKALGVSEEGAVSIQHAIIDAHLKVPLLVRGMGDKAVDLSYKLPGMSPIIRQYSKLQGALRFSYNPFFQYLRVIPKTEILAQAEGGGAIASIFTGRTGQIKDIRAALHEGGFLNETGHLGTVVSGEAEASFGTVGRNINKKLLKGQEISVAGLIDAQAQRMGMTWQDYLKTNQQAARDTIQMIVEYDRNANFLNSPLARTLNVAIFPFRFDTKVVSIIGKNLAQSSLATQVGVINGMMKAHDFFTSPEGQAWYAQNSTVLGLINYITPFAHIAEVFQSLLPGHDHSLGNFGALGGLPFGWIPALLDAEGLTHFNQPGMDAKTGQMFPTYVPATDKGQLAIAIQDLIGQVFSYPGAELGLPSKGSITRNVALGLTGASKRTDLKLTTPSPNAQQLAYSMTLKPAQPIEVSQPTQGATTVPTQQLAPVQPVYKPGSGTKKKKTQYTPEMMPGQTQLGVIQGQ